MKCKTAFHDEDRHGVAHRITGLHQPIIHDDLLPFPFHEIGPENMACVGSRKHFQHLELNALRRNSRGLARRRRGGDVSRGQRALDEAETAVVAAATRACGRGGLGPR